MVFTVDDLRLITGGTGWRWVTNVKICRGSVFSLENRVSGDKTKNTLPTHSEVLKEYEARFGLDNIKLGFAYRPNGDIFSWDRFVAVYVKR
jgi:hypothetical protein